MLKCVLLQQDQLGQHAAPLYSTNGKIHFQDIPAPLKSVAELNLRGARFFLQIQNRRLKSGHTESTRSLMKIPKFTGKKIFA